MLKVQPTNIMHSSSRTPSFKGGDIGIDEQTYNEKKNYYTKQNREFDEILQDQYVPEGMKKGVKVFKIVSEGILEGWAVAWAASKGAKFAKSGINKIFNSKTLETFAKITKPLRKGIADTGENVKTHIVKLGTKIKNSEFVTNLSEKAANITEKMQNNSVGKFTLKIGSGIKKCFQALKNTITTVAQKVADSFKKITFEKATKGSAATLGVGAGLAGAYNAAREDFIKNEKDNTNRFSDFDEFENNSVDEAV